MKRCDLCGKDGYDVQSSVVRYRDGTYAAVQRCKDATACEDRVIGHGKTWNVARPRL